MTFEFDVAYFRLHYPQFASATVYPDLVLQGYWDNAICYINPEDYGYLSGASRYLALNLMTAHLAAIADLIAKKQVPGLVQGATTDKISITLTPPKLQNQWQWWLNLTAYGQQLLALLQVKAVGGFYIGGAPVAALFANQGYGN